MLQNVAYHAFVGVPRCNVQWGYDIRVVVERLQVRDVRKVFPRRHQVGDGIPCLSKSIDDGRLCCVVAVIR